MIVRLRRSSLVVLLAVVLSTLLVVEQPARAQAVPEPVINAAGQVYGFLTQSAAGGSQMISQWDGRYFEVLHKWEQATGGWAPGVKHTVGNVMQSMRAAVRPAYPYLARVGVGSAATASAASTVAAAGGVGVALPAATAAVAAGTGVLVGWGAVEAGVWTWAGCEHWLNTGNGRCESDPVPPTEGGGGPGEPGAHGFRVYEDYVNTSGETRGWAWTYSGYEHTLSGPKPVPIVSSGEVAYLLDELPGGSGNLRLALFDSDGVQCTGWNVSPTSNFDGTGSWGGQHRITGVDGAGCGTGGVAKIQVVNRSTGEVVAEQGTQEGAGDAVADRTVRTEAECLDPDTGNTETVVAETDPYAPGEEMITPRVDCPAGYPIVASANITREVDGQPEASEALFTYEAPEALTDPDPSDPLTAAGCYQGECDLVLHKGDETGPDCEDGETVCLGWWDQMTNGTGEYTCTWGGVVVPWTDCEPFANVDNNDAPQAGENPAGPNPSAPPGTASNPAHVEDGCDAGGGSWWNPFDNIAGGVACAIEWAFVPSAEAMDGLEASTASMAESVPFTYVSQINGWATSAFGDVDSMAGCLQFEAPVEGFGTYDVFDCNGPVGSKLATTWRPLLTVAVWGMFLLPLAWWAWRQYAPGSQGEA